MTFQQKYVVVEKYDQKVAILFPELIEHAAFQNLNPVSAGFFWVDFEKKRVFVHGSSTSLGLATHEDDPMLILALLAGDTKPYKVFPN